jgi:NAD(P)-dependent dehydrogenase (short-subunit alcohol dehydrogenase family)
VADIAARHGRIDVLVNNVGGSAAGGPVAGFLAEETKPQPPAQPSGQGIDTGLIDSLTRR